MTTPTPTDIDLAAGSLSVTDYKSLLTPGFQNDYGTPNLLFFYYLPLIPDSKKGDLVALQEEIQAWHAYELGRAEESVATKVKSKELPNDDSAKARRARTNYRAKVVQALRNRGESWAPIFKNDSKERASSGVKQTDVNAVIIRELLAHYAPANSSQFTIILKLVNFLVASDYQANHSYWFTQVHLNYNSESQDFEPSISTSSFQITIEKPEPKPAGKDQGKEQDGKEEEKDLVDVIIGFHDYAIRFSRDTWAKFRSGSPSKEKHYFEEGEKIRQGMSIDFSSNK